MILNLGRKWALKRVRALMARRKPDFLVGDPVDPQLRRWMLLKKNFFFNIYFHEFCKSDGDVPHDHPTANMSWILNVGYWEWRLVNDPSIRIAPAELRFFRTYNGVMRKHWVPEGAVKARWAKTPHRVELHITGSSIHNPITIFFCGPRLNPNWRFWCPQGQKKWQDYVAPYSYGNRVGKGCD